MVRRIYRKDKKRAKVPGINKINPGRKVTLRDTSNSSPEEKQKALEKALKSLKQK